MRRPRRSKSIHRSTSSFSTPVAFSAERWREFNREMSRRLAEFEIRFAAVKTLHLPACRDPNCEDPHCGHGAADTGPGSDMV